jgi:hypothetical protein
MIGNIQYKRLQSATTNARESALNLAIYGLPSRKHSAKSMAQHSSIPSKKITSEPYIMTQRSRLKTAANTNLFSLKQPTLI